MRRLNAYLDRLRGTPLVWGEHDCLTFTNGAWHVMHGRGFADELLGRYVRMGLPLPRARLLELIGAGSYEAYLDRRLSRVRHVPPRGALVMSGEPAADCVGLALGICIGTSVALVAPDGLMFRPVEVVAGAWVA